MSMNKTRKEKRQARRRREQMRTRLMWGGFGIVLIILIGVVLYEPPLPPPPESEQSFPIMGADHIPDGTNPGVYNSDPPTSGQHYAAGLERGFYDEADLSQLSQYPIGHIVHNLEHGYIIFWYNCELIEDTECAALKSEIQAYMDDSINKKLIAFPWESTDSPLVLTSWGKMLEQEEFDGEVAKSFIDRNRGNAPEPNAP